MQPSILLAAMLVGVPFSILSRIDPHAAQEDGWYVRSHIISFSILSRIVPHAAQ